MIPLPAQNFDVPHPSRLQFDSGIRRQQGAYVDLARQGDRGLLPDEDNNGNAQKKKRGAARAKEAML